MDRTFTVAIRTLDAAGCRTCWERMPRALSVFAFSETGSVCIDLNGGAEHRRSPWRALNGSTSPCIALLGPDGGGKSTALPLGPQGLQRETPLLGMTGPQL